MVTSKKRKHLKPDPSPKWMSSCVGLVYFQKSTRIKTTASGLSYGVGVNGEKKNGNWDIKKNGHSTFHTDKPGNFDILREVIWIILWHCYLEIDWRWESVPKKVLWLLTSFRWYV